MALQKQVIDIPLGQGLDQKSDEFLIQPGKLARAENIIFRKRGRIQKRSGFVRESTKNTYKVFAQDKGVLQLEGSTSADYLSLNTIGTSEVAIGEWKSVPRAHIEHPGISGAHTWHADSDFIQGTGNTEGFTATVTLGYDGSDVPKLDVTFIDNETGLVDTSATLTVASATSSDNWHAVKCKTHRTQSQLVIAACGTFGGTARVKLYYITFGATTINLVETVDTSLYSSLCPVFDLETFGHSTVLLYKDASSATTLNVKLYNASYSGGSASTTTTDGESYAACLNSLRFDGYSSDADGTTTFVVLGWVDNDGVLYKYYSRTKSTSATSFGSSAGPVVLTTDVDTSDLTSLGPNVMVGCGNIDSSTDSTFWVSKNNDATIRVFDYVIGTGAINASCTVYGHAVVSKPYAVSETSATSEAGEYVLTQPVWSSGTTPRHYSLLRRGGSSVTEKARLAYGVALGTISLFANALPVAKLHKNGSSSDKFAGIVYLVSDAPSNGTLNANHSAPSSVAAMSVFDKSRTASISAVDASGSLLFTGGSSLSFDGVAVAPNGLLYPPEVVSFGSIVGAGSLVSGQEYSLIAVLEYTDAKGRFHQSAPSAPKAMTASTTKAEAVIRLVPQSLPPNAIVSLYRAGEGSSTYYRTAYFRATSNTLDYTINSNDLNTSSSSIAGNTVLYTQSSELANIQLGSTVAIAADAGRVYAVSGDDLYTVRISKPMEQWRGIAFFNGADRRVPTEGGPITALARMDGKLYVFKQKAVYVANGDGPNITGADDTLSDLYTFSTAFGANDQSSVLVCDLGVLCFGPKGFWLIGRDQSAQYIGAAIEDVVSASSRCYGMAYVQDTDEIHCAMGTLGELVYAVQFGQWSRNTNVQAMSIVSPKQSIGSTLGAYYVCTDPTNAAFLPGVFRAGQSYSGSTAWDDDHDATAADNLFTMAVGLGWIHFAGVQGLQRVYEGLIIGRSKDTHTVRVSISYDYVDTVVDTFTITSANATTGSSQHQFRFFPSRQKCQAMKILIEDVVASGSQAFELVGMSLVVGMKPGAAKLPSAKVAT